MVVMCGSWDVVNLSLHYKNFGPDSLANGTGCWGLCCKVLEYVKPCLGKMNVVAGSVDFLLLHTYSLKGIII